MSNRNGIKVVVMLCATSMIWFREPHVYIIGVIGLVSGLGILVLGEK